MNPPSTPLLSLPASLIFLLINLVTPASAIPTTTSINASAIYYQSTGSGSSYASACLSAHNAYDSSSSAWISKNANVSTETTYFGGTTVSEVTFYANATTLCDGHARVTASPAVPISSKLVTHSGPITSTNTYTATGWYGSPFGVSPLCTISPTDCDPLWQDYSTSLRAWPSGGVTAAPQTPFCANQSAASSYASFESSLRGCGDCTIYGDGVELLYFPVPSTVSRDMCATEPSATLTHYGTDDVLEVWAGKSYGAEQANTANLDTVVFDGHTFTSGTAYISISTVYAVDRCSKPVGSTIHDAILAMHSSAVLSLRYSQNHFQALWVTDQQTGYPVSYADFNSPVPYSAWIGQAQCGGSYDSYYCGVIYENNYRPQLAIPPGIKKLDPQWSTCQMYFRGLYDPPQALTPVATAATPTVPGNSNYATTAAEPVSMPTAQNGPTTPAAPAPTKPVQTAQYDSAAPTRTHHPDPDYGTAETPHRHRKHRTTTIVTLLVEHTVTMQLAPHTTVKVAQAAPSEPVTVVCEGQNAVTTVVGAFGQPQTINAGTGDDDGVVVVDASGQGTVVVEWVVEGEGGSEDGSEAESHAADHSVVGSSTSSGSGNGAPSGVPAPTPQASSGLGAGGSSKSGASAGDSTTGGSSTGTSTAETQNAAGAAAREKRWTILHSVGTVLSALFLAGL